ncbi:potassium channel subfamily t member 1, partial [Plakobranchus ocellatus]
MFRLPFAAGKVFSSGMLDRLLYQTFVKGYLISFVRLLLGIDAEKNSGHLSSVCIQRATLSQFPNYGDLYQGLCSTTGEIPIAIYRTEKHNFASNEQGDQNGTKNTTSHKNSNSQTARWMGSLCSNTRRASNKSYLSVASTTLSPPESPDAADGQETGSSSPTKLRPSRVSMSSRLFAVDQESNRHLGEMVQARMESLGLAQPDKQ